jgi:hypothetical protein
VRYAGFVAGEENAALGGTLAYAGNSQGAVAADDYTIAAQGLSAANYQLNYVPGSLHVLTLPPIVLPAMAQVPNTQQSPASPPPTALPRFQATSPPRVSVWPCRNSVPWVNPGMADSR